MSKSIAISTDVFAAIWAARQEGEESEDDILRRLLLDSGLRQDVQPFSGSVHAEGVNDSRNNVFFPKGFLVFRGYKGQHFEAEALNGEWKRRDNGQRYASLNQLNASIVRGNENIWNGNWKYKNEKDEIASIADLR
jgi:hypothetical protein